MIREQSTEAQSAAGSSNSLKSVFEVDQVGREKCERSCVIVDSGGLMGFECGLDW